MADYPDWTSAVHLVGTEIMLPVDIQAQYVTLGVDIVAQTVGNITIDIAAQTVGNIHVNLAASAITMNVNISSQTANINVNLAASAITISVAVTGTANINITAQTVGIYGERDWAAFQNYDLLLTVTASFVQDEEKNIITYTVPSGKVLYVNDLSFSGNIRVGWLQLRRSTTPLWQIEWVSSTAYPMVFHEFPTPIKYTAGQVLNLRVYNYDFTPTARANLGCRLVPA